MNKINSMHIGILFLAVALLSNCSKASTTRQPAETLPKISLDDVTKREGNIGTTEFPFTVSLDKASAKTVIVKYSTTEGFAKGSADFTPASETITFMPNETKKSISISVAVDDLKEANEGFKVILSNPVNGIISKDTGIGMIQNDDTKVGFTDAGYDAPTS